MINTEDFVDDGLTIEEQMALLDFFMTAADALDGGDVKDLEKYYVKAIQNEKHPLSKLYSELNDANSL